MHTTTAGSTLVLHGNFDVRTTFQVRTALYAHLDSVGGDATVDLSQVDNVDVTALKVLAYATRQANRDGNRLTLRGAGPAVLRLLHKSRLIRVVQVDRHAATA
jgi:anti-anti-sigma factor